VMRLTTNMRVRRSDDSRSSEAVQEFADYLIQIGEGRHDTCDAFGPEYAKLVDDIVQASNTSEAQDGVARLISSVYDGIESGNLHLNDYFAKRVILASKNDDVADLNNSILDKLPGEPAAYLSVDSIDGSEELEGQLHSHLYPIEFLSSLSLGGISPHKLRLKVGAPVMLIRNLNAQDGPCNGTRRRVVRLSRHCMQAVVMSGVAVGKEVVIPRVNLRSKENLGLAFQLRRKQYPVQLAFAMTINKSQG
jgi:ATP-dependent exoDNAse (exonuclease V) alpha subunit